MKLDKWDWCHWFEPRKEPEWTWKVIRSMYSVGYSIEEIAKHYNLSVAEIERIVGN